VRPDGFLLRRLQLAKRAVAHVVVRDGSARVIQEGARSVFAALRELVNKTAFLNELTGSVHRLAAHCGTRAAQLLRPITRCDDLAGGTAKVLNSS
jgi:hypothetical protein